MSRRARRLGWAARVVAFCPDSRSPGEEAGSQTRTLARSAPGGLGAPRRRLATRTRTRLEGVGRRSPHAPLQPSTPALPLPPSAPGPRPSALAPPSRLHAPLAGPLRAPQGSGQPGCLWQPRERPQSKRRSKEKAKEEQRPGPCGLAWRWGWVGGGDTESAGKAPGVARGLQAHPPLAARVSPPLPFPGSRRPFCAAPFSSPRALSAPARGSVPGIKRKEGGEKGGEGKGRRRKKDDPSKGGC